MSMIRGKRELLAHGVHGCGLTRLLNCVRKCDQLLVLNYHRIGSSGEDLFDPAVYSATPDRLSDQISYLKRHADMTTLDEALALIDGKASPRARRCRVLLTFDDGYLDNYQAAFPVLRAHKVHGVFFLVTQLVGSCHLPWWDRIAYIMRTARRRSFALHYPAYLAVNIDRDGIMISLREVLKLYKKPDMTDGEYFVGELLEVTRGDIPERTIRRFLNWEEARDMLAHGMAIQSHTHSHTVLSQLSTAEQYKELTVSRTILQQELGTDINVLSYPVGIPTSFSEETCRIAQQVGYRGAFSFYGGSNSVSALQRYDIMRVGIGDQSWTRFRVQTAVCRASGHFWP